jgi:decaprenylphospho-beta-D-ribofuranose 2-oxidase
MTYLSGWGNYPVAATQCLAEGGPTKIAGLVGTHGQLIARGMGRAYGDAAIGQNFTVPTLGLNRLRSFDAATGLLRVEAGVSIADVLATFAPRGYFFPVVPGTKFITVGGAIAADVHGKNHHLDGGFVNGVEDFRLVTSGGESLTCSRKVNPQLFAATAGGMGLTGIIVEATLRLRPIETGWLRQQTHIADDLDAAIAALELTAASTYSVAWIDCLATGKSLGRSLIYAADHASAQDCDLLGVDGKIYASPRTVRLAAPLYAPGWFLNRASVGAFNALYFSRGSARAGRPELVHWDPYFFPLDAIGQWNRIYGRRGFVQHQCVIPLHAARGVLAEILDRVSRRSSVSFLAVLKQLGESNGMMSFPMRGYTLAMDFPMTDTLLPFLDELDTLVTGAGGRLYLAKDARQSRATLEAGYPEITAFRELRKHTGADKHFASHLSARLGI